MPRLPYDPERDFAPITNLVTVPLAIVAHPSLPANTPAELIALARASRDPLDMATAGPASGAHMAGELFAHMAGIRLNMVHYRGSGPAMSDLVGGQVRLMVDSLASALPSIRAGRIKCVGVANPRRSAWLPDVPALAEAVPGYEAFGWNGLAAPAGTPAPVLARIGSEVGAILRDPAMAPRLEELGMLPDPQTPEQFAAFLRAEIAKWREVARVANVRLEG
jgi:tripartite-type tricarboxylate transporter receptor subunit TctC